MSNNNRVRDRLLSEYPPDEVGIWKILGEDPNCEFGGYHHEPFLEQVSGTYRNVVEYALKLHRFFSWGYGGRIVKLSSKSTKNVDKVVDASKIKELEAEKKNLQDRIKQIDEEINSLL